MKPQVLIIIGYVLLAAGYAALTPIFEAPDESYHFAFVQRLAQDPMLPVQDPTQITPWFQEGSQPPLYYYLASLIVRISGGTEPILELPRNPHAAIGIGLAAINQNAYLHRGTGTDIPVPLSRAFYLTRALSILLGVITLLGVKGTADRAFPHAPQIGLLALAVTAFNPQFLFMTASINNDNLVAALSAIGLWKIMELLHGGGWREAVIIAGIAGMAALTKLSGLILYPTAAAAVAALIWKRRLLVRRGLLMGLLWSATFALIAGWWFLRNRLLYGDWTGTNLMIAIIEPRHTPYTLGVMLSEMEGLRISFWALFGWFNVIGASWLYPLMDGLTALALVGGIVYVVGVCRRKAFEALLPVGILALHLGITFAALINWTRLTPGTQGRLLFPALGAISALSACGWWTISKYAGRWRMIVAALPLVPLLVMSLSGSVGFIAPAYAPPPVIADLPQTTIPTHVRYAHIEVIGYHIDPRPIRPGDALPLTLYLRATGNARNLSLFLTALDPAGNAVGTVDTYPGGGDLPTSAFESGVIYADTYLIPIAADAPTPMQSRIAIGFWDGTPENRIPPVGTKGEPLETLILHGGTVMNPDLPPPPATPLRAVFSGALQMNGYSLRQKGSTLEVAVQWVALTQVYEDFNVLVHVQREGDLQPTAQGDSAPRAGAYPTSAWAVGVPFEDLYRIDVGDLSPGRYHILIGLYRLGDISRLPLEGGGDVVRLEPDLQIDKKP